MMEALKAKSKLSGGGTQAAEVDRFPGLQIDFQNSRDCCTEKSCLKNQQQQGGKTNKLKKKNKGEKSKNKITIQSSHPLQGAHPHKRR